MEEDIYEGYYIPAGATVFANLWWVHDISSQLTLILLIISSKLALSSFLKGYVP